MNSEGNSQRLTKARTKKNANPLTEDSRNRTRVKVVFQNEEAFSLLLGDVEELKKLDARSLAEDREGQVIAHLRYFGKRQTQIKYWKRKYSGTPGARKEVGPDDDVYDDYLKPENRLSRKILEVAPENGKHKSIISEDQVTKRLKVSRDKCVKVQKIVEENEALKTQVKSLKQELGAKANLEEQLKVIRQKHTFVETFMSKLVHSLPMEGTESEKMRVLKKKLGIEEQGGESQYNELSHITSPKSIPDSIPLPLADNNVQTEEHKDPSIVLDLQNQVVASKEEKISPNEGIILVHDLFQSEDENAGEDAESSFFTSEDDRVVFKENILSQGQLADKLTTTEAKKSKTTTLSKKPNVPADVLGIMIKMKEAILEKGKSLNEIRENITTIPNKWRNVLKNHEAELIAFLDS